jgi:hypothetical protein
MTEKDNKIDNEIANNTKLIMFSRWMALNYSNDLSIQRGEWYKSQLDHFNNNIYPDYIKDGTVNKYKELYNK